MVTSLSMLEPCSLIYYLWNHVGIHIEPNQVAHYWRFNREHGAAWAVNHEASEKHIPLAVYGDAAKTRSTPLGPEKVLGVFLSCPLWRPRSIRCSRWLVFAIMEDQLYSWKTLHQIYRRIVFSLNILFTGIMPSKGIDDGELPKIQVQPGQPLFKQKLRFAVTEIRGDWAYHKELFRFKSSWKAGATMPVCFLCKAMSAEEPFYFKVALDSPCWNTLYNLTDFLTEQMPDKGSWLLPILETMMFLLQLRTCGEKPHTYDFDSFYFVCIQTCNSFSPQA